MRRFITAIADTIITVFGTRPSGNVVTGLATPRLRALNHARSLLLRLTGRVPARLRVVEMGHGQAADAGAGPARVLKPYRLSTMWPRRGCRPAGRGASIRRF